MISSRKISSRNKIFIGSCSGGNESKVRGPKGEGGRVPKSKPWLLDLVNKTEPSWAEAKGSKHMDNKGVGSRVNANKRARTKVTDSKGARTMAGAGQGGDWPQQDRRPGQENRKYGGRERGIIISEGNRNPT
jgi:hypothetical protein